jgi:hypothetical protein
MSRKSDFSQLLVLQRSLPELPAAVAAEEPATTPRLIQNNFLVSDLHRPLVALLWRDV